MSWLRARLPGLGVRVAVYLAIALVVGFSARQAKLLDTYFIYFPERDFVETPADVGLAYEDVTFSTSDGLRLHGWFVRAQSDTTIVWFHGNAGNISHRVDNLLLLYQHLEANIFIFDYRGYGNSQGKPSEEGTYRDGEAAIEYVLRRDVSEHRKLVLFGRSVGSAVAVELATRNDVHALILESPFTSIKAMGRATYPFLPINVLILAINARYDSLSKIGRVNSPVMVLHGNRDEIVPMEQGWELYNAANEPKKFYTIEGAGHNDTYAKGGTPYFQALKRFVEDATRAD